VERTERLTRRILEIALAFKQPLMLITKNALIERDIDLLTQLAEQRLVQVAVSLTTLNEELRRKLEPRTSTGPQRLEVIENLSKAHIPVLAMIAPVIPALNEPEVPELLRRASLSGALGAGYTVLRLNGPVRPVFERWLRHHYPDRAEKVLAQTRALHGGDANDSVHGRRMKGEGAFATNIQRLFQVMHARYFSQKVVPVLKSSLFSPPPKGQLDLFQ
jgi:DNA repair photolyase